MPNLFLAFGGKEDAVFGSTGNDHVIAIIFFTICFLAIVWKGRTE